MVGVGREECLAPKREGGLATLPMLFLHRGREDTLMEIVAAIARSLTKFRSGISFSRRFTVNKKTPNLISVQLVVEIGR